MLKIKFLSLLIMTFYMTILSNDEWFQTWNRPEYKEWAKPTDYGYLLHIIRVENNGYLVAKAKLIMGENGLPGFEMIEQSQTTDIQEVIKKFNTDSTEKSNNDGWFNIWNRPEYFEWAKPTDYGYLLHIIRVENSGYLVAKAKLIMGENGLPEFEIIEQSKKSDIQEAGKQIQLWMGKTN